MQKRGDDNGSKDSSLRWNNDDVDGDSMPTKKSTGGCSFQHLPFRRDSLSAVDASISSSFHPFRTPDEFLLMEVQVDSAVSATAEGNEDNWGLLDDSDAHPTDTSIPLRLAVSPPSSPRRLTATTSISTMHLSTDEAPIVTPQQQPRWPSMASPLPSSSPQHLPAQFRRAKSRFALSMQRSEQTRIIVQHLYSGGPLGTSTTRGSKGQQYHCHASTRRRVYRFLLQEQQNQQRRASIKTQPTRPSACWY